MLVTGEAGVGKTRLVDDLRAQAGAVTAEARGYPAEGPLAYGVATAWLRSAPVAARLSRLGRPDLTELSRLLPELAARATPPEPLPAAELRHRLLGAIGRALLAAGAPLLLIVDDAQWADAQSLGLIHYLIRSAPPARLLVAATARREELDQHHPLTGLTTALQALGHLTEFEFRLHPLGPTVLAGLMVFPVGRAPEVLRCWRDWADGAPDEVSTGCAVITAPPEPFVPAHLHGQPVLGIPVLYVGDPEDGAVAVQPLRELGPAVDHVGPMPYTAFQAVLDPLAPPGWRSYARGEYMPGFSDAAIDTFLAHAAA